MAVKIVDSTWVPGQLKEARRREPNLDGSNECRSCKKRPHELWFVWWKKDGLPADRGFFCNADCWEEFYTSPSNDQDNGSVYE